MKSRLITGDALEVLRKFPADSFDVGVTSPPYNKQENKKGWLVKNVKYCGASDKKGESAYQREQIAVLNELYRVTKPGGSFFYNHKTRWERGDMLHPLAWIAQTEWTIRQEIIWDRQIAANIRGWRFWQVDERIYWLIKPVGDDKIGKELESRHAKLTSIWRFSPERDNPHPAPFPLRLPTRAICAVLPDRKGAIIDPYCGSGTTCVAAMLLGHDYVGVDMSPEYIKASRERIRRGESERADLEKETELHQIRDSFADRKRNGGHVGRFAPGRKEGNKEAFSLPLSYSRDLRSR